MSNRRRPAAMRSRRVTMCGRPKCDREATHVLDVGDGSYLAACTLHWPQLVSLLEREGLQASGCLGPCCA